MLILCYTIHLGKCVKPKASGSGQKSLTSKQNVASLPPLLYTNHIGHVFLATCESIYASALFSQLCFSAMASYSSSWIHIRTLNTKLTQHFFDFEMLYVLVCLHTKIN